MVLYMKENFWMIKNMDKVSKLILMVGDMKDNLNKMKYMDKELRFIQMEVNMRGLGKKI